MQDLLLLPARVSSFLKTKKVKVDRTQEVANTIARYSSDKAKALKKELSLHQEQAKLDRKELENVKRVLDSHKRETSFLKKKYNYLQTEKPQLVISYKKTIQELISKGGVDEVAIDSKKRIIITTKPLKVKKEKWHRAKTAGQYQIRIDFSKESFRDGIEILNITRFFKHYQSPTISGTKPCWGNIADDIDFEFKIQDIFQLVTDLIDYIKSPKDSAGFIHLPNNEKDTGWEQFFKNAVKRKEGFSFKTYRLNKAQDAERNELGATEETLTSDDGLVASGGSGSGSITNITHPIPIGTWITASSSGTSLSTDNMLSYTQFSRPRLSEYHQEVFRGLTNMGLTEDAAYHFLPSVAPEGAVYCRRIELTLIDDNIARMEITRGDPEPISATEAMMDVEAFRLAPMSRHATERYAINRQDIRESEWQQLVQSHRVSFQFNTSRFRNHMMQESRAERIRIAYEPLTDSDNVIDSRTPATLAARELNITINE